ncbi:hypothetical protein BDZ90DRAFT_273301 [Jaminaea rosea]|uniref:Ig-like domain-containing protein n=1 Tax=Jaminaea rosea TaxID=1569628 RepID=A0A316V0N1_9BASI|nr:hypothetical protein BDZ90DRAFT_273301 [Jaminaea rosea]PWN31106.1 hypothetical protein BDZ90DRAFT_273301 [Jaminaea rosea]
MICVLLTFALLLSQTVFAASIAGGLNIATTSGPAPRGFSPSVCSQPGRRCIFAPSYISIRSSGIIDTQQTDSEALIVMGQAFGSCPNSTRTDTIDWAYTSVTPPANVPQLASASGGKEGNLLLKAYFGDNAGKVTCISSAEMGLRSDELAVMEDISPPTLLLMSSVSKPVSPSTLI